MSVTQDTAKKQSVERFRGQALVSRIKELIHQGNVRRIVVKNDDGHTVMEIPVTAGVVAAIAAPVVTAIAAIAALTNEWTIEVDHVEPHETVPSDEATAKTSDAGAGTGTDEVAGAGADQSEAD